MVNRHLDNLGGIERWLETLDEEETAIYEQGFQAGLAKLISQFRQSKIKLLEKLCGLEWEDGSNADKIQVEAKIKLLDIYDDHYSKMLERLSERTPLLPFSDSTTVE